MPSFDSKYLSVTSFGQFFLFKRISNLSFDTSNTVDKFSRCVFKLNSSNFYIDNSGFGIVFQIHKTFGSKIGFNSMYILPTLKTGDYIGTKFHNKLKNENCINTKSYNKLKPITYLQNSAYLINLHKSSTFLLREPKLVTRSRVFFHDYSFDFSLTKL